MTTQRIETDTHDGIPLEYHGVNFRSQSGFAYRLTSYTTEDHRIVWVRGYRVVGRMPVWTDRTPDELTPESLAELHRLRREGRI